MARIELSNIGGGGGTTLSLTTTGTSGASTLAGSVLNIPVYQGQLTLTTMGTSGAATLSGTTLNIPQYSGGGGTPAGSTGQIQYNNAGAFAASANLAWDDTNVRLNIGAPSSPTARLNVKGAGALSSTSTQIWTNSGNTELVRFSDNGYCGFGVTAPLARVHIRGGVLDSFKVESTTAELYNQFISTAGTGEFGIFNDAFYFQALATLSNGVRFFGSNDGASRMQLSQAGNVSIGTLSDVARLGVQGSNTTSGVGAFLVQDGAATPVAIYRIDNDGKVTYRATNTAAGTTGAQTINRPSGTVNFGIGAGSLVVTNSLCTASSIVFATVRTNDATAYIKNVVPAAGSFTINLGANATAETSVGFFIIN